MNERKLLQAIVATWLAHPVPVNADRAANDLLAREPYGHEEMTSSLVNDGYLIWDHSTAPNWVVEYEDRWIMVVPTAQGIFEAIS